nr:MAG TPA: hypothetical protein [Caudoviricetes sp.]
MSNYLFRAENTPIFFTIDFFHSSYLLSWLIFWFTTLDVLYTHRIKKPQACSLDFSSNMVCTVTIK